jgi:hypothetical protein
VLAFTNFGLSPVPFDTGLLLLVNAAVNLHHFVLDGAIWKLRDGTVARILEGAFVIAAQAGARGRVVVRSAFRRKLRLLGQRRKRRSHGAHRGDASTVK